MRVFVIAIILATVGFWTWAFSPWAPSGHPDKLEGKDFTIAAELYCSGIFPDGEWLPNGLPEIADSPEERAVLAQAANEEMERMVNGLEDLADDFFGDLSADESGAKDIKLINEWTADWRSYLQDREVWIEKLARGEDTPLVITGIDDGRPSVRLEVFAEINNMASCAVPDFV